MAPLSSEPDLATREAFTEAMQKCIEDAFTKIMGPDDHSIEQMRQLVPGGVKAYFASPNCEDPHHMPYQMFCKGMLYQRVRKPLNA